MTNEMPCWLCSGEIGPDVTGRPMCYGCGPAEMAPEGKRRGPAFTCAGYIDIAKMEALLPGVREAVKAAEARGDTSPPDEVRPSPETLETWRSAGRPLSPAAQRLADELKEHREAWRGFDEAKRDAAVSISETPAAMLGEAKRHMEEARKLLLASGLSGDDETIERLDGSLACVSGCIERAERERKA